MNALHLMFETARVAKGPELVEKLRGLQWNLMPTDIHVALDERPRQDVDGATGDAGPDSAATSASSRT